MTLIKKILANYLIFFGATAALLAVTALPVAGQGPAPADVTPSPHHVYLPFINRSEPPQLLQNPSFEASADSVAPWQWLTADTAWRIEAGGLPAINGRQVVAANRTNSEFGNKSIYQDAGPPQAGVTYHFSIWLRAADAAIAAGKPRTGRLALWAFNGAPAREHATINFQLHDTNWHCIETALTVQQAGHAALRAELYFTALDNFDTYLDAATLRNDGQPTCPADPTAPQATLVNQGQGFDTCAAPTTGQLAAWQAASPYQYLGIYLGGDNHYTPCRTYNQTYQTAAWFSAARQQGWRFIPIWVGPQAPCTGYNVRLSQDATTARSQGIAEAQRALQAAAQLGLTAGQKSIIYFDMEYYDTRLTACHNAVNAFLEGWVSELQNNGHQAGIYGSVYAAEGWYTLKHVPDSVWLPWYIRSSYDPAVTVDTLNQQWVTASYWGNHRLFQYGGSHTESWGGVPLNIDNNAARGLVALSGQSHLQKMALIAPGRGWILLNGRLYSTGDNGGSWRDISPPGAPSLADAAFVDARHGWAVALASDRVQLWRTANGGASWQNLNIDDSSSAGISAAYLNFASANVGGLVLKQATGPSFSRGRLLVTTDGGASWQPRPVPLGEPVRFVTDQLAWVAGGPAGSELYVTRNGGQSWQPQNPAQNASGGAVFSLPVFENEQTGALAASVTVGNRSQVQLYATTDAGQNWQLTGSVPLAAPLAFGAGAPVSVLNAQEWLVALPDVTPNLPSNVTAVQLVSATAGWAQTTAFACTAAGCQPQSGLFSTGDGGQQWQPVTLPE
ncbi:MAG: hypothetical protein FOGNACKC_00479 [Anaerolineae bacterium]|nr:hypothetical protein [Anaerolineae bacterium]